MRHDFAVELRIDPAPLQLIHPVDYRSHRGVTQRLALAVGEDVLAVILRSSMRSSTASAALLNGTLCSASLFMSAAGIIHTDVCRSIWSHLAVIALPGLTAVRI